jgi:hypothetical protein
MCKQLLTPKGLIGNEEAQVKIAASGVGAITEGDIHTATATGAIILGFHTAISGAVNQLAKRSGVTFQLYQVIYDLLDDVKAELRRRVMDSDSWKAHGKWGSANAKCHNGEGPTGLRVDLASGAVTCWQNCSLQRILEAYGLELPKNRSFDYIEAPKQTSSLYQWYQQNK